MNKTIVFGKWAAVALVASTMGSVFRADAGEVKIKEDTIVLQKMGFRLDRSTALR